MISTREVETARMLWQDARVRDLVCMAFTQSRIQMDPRLVLAESGADLSQLRDALGRCMTDEARVADAVLALPWVASLGGVAECSRHALGRGLVARAIREALVVDVRFGVAAGAYLSSYGKLRVVRCWLRDLPMTEEAREFVLGMEVEFSRDAVGAMGGGEERRRYREDRSGGGGRRQGWRGRR